jgi:hypothetical protein
VSEGDLPWLRRGSAAEQAGVGNGVMRGTEGPGGDKSVLRIEQPADGMDFRRFDRFLQRQRRHDRGHPLGDHRLSRAGRADHQEIMIPRRGHLHRPAHVVLAAHVGDRGFPSPPCRGGPPPRWPALPPKRPPRSPLQRRPRRRRSRKKPSRACRQTLAKWAEAAKRKCAAALCRQAADVCIVRLPLALRRLRRGAIARLHARPRHFTASSPPACARRRTGA